MKRFCAALFLFALALPAAVPSPEEYFGFRIGSRQETGPLGQDRRVHAGRRQRTDRVRFRNLGPHYQRQSVRDARNQLGGKPAQPGPSQGVSNSKLYFQGGAPTDAERDEIFRSGKAVVFITNNIHSTEIGASQMVIELVHRPRHQTIRRQIKKVLDNVILLLVPSLNPDGQIMVTDWYNKTLGTP